jgi:hypothetical protein
MRWKIWYADGTTKEGVRQQTWLNASSEGVLCVGVRYPCPPGLPRGSLIESDWYWWNDGPKGGVQTWITGRWSEYDGPILATETAKRGTLVSDAERDVAYKAMVDWVNRG